MRKDMRDFSVSGGLIVQMYETSPPAKIYNAVDSAYLTTNYLYQSYVAEIDSRVALFKAYEFMDKDRKFIRFPHNKSFTLESGFWNRPDNCSRDNSMGTICCLVELNDKDTVRFVAKDMIKRYSFFQNTRTVSNLKKKVPADLCIAEWAVIYRGLMKKENRWMHYPVLFFLDMLMLFSVFIYIARSWEDKTYNSPLFHMISQLLCCNRNTPTVASKMSWFCLTKMLPGSPGYYHKNKVISQLMEYSRAPYDPPIYQVTEKVLK